MYIWHIDLWLKLKLNTNDFLSNWPQDLNDWLQVLQEVASRAEEREARIRQMVRQTNLSQELSDLVVYFQPVPFNLCCESSGLVFTSDIRLSLIHISVCFWISDGSSTKTPALQCWKQRRVLVFLRLTLSLPSAKLTFSQPLNKKYV